MVCLELVTTWVSKHDQMTSSLYQLIDQLICLSRKMRDWLIGMLKQTWRYSNFCSCDYTRVFFWNRALVLQPYVYEFGSQKIKLEIWITFVAKKIAHLILLFYRKHLHIGLKLSIPFFTYKKLQFVPTTSASTLI